MFWSVYTLNFLWVSELFMLLGPDFLFNQYKKIRILV